MHIMHNVQNMQSMQNMQNIEVCKLIACLNESKDEPWHAEEVEDKCILCIIYNNITCRDMSYLIVLQQNNVHVC